MLIGILELFIVNNLFKVFFPIHAIFIDIQKNVNHLLCLQMNKNKYIPNGKSFRSWERNTGYYTVPTFLCFIVSGWEKR